MRKQNTATVHVSNLSKSTLQRIKAAAARFGVIGDAPAVRFALEQYVAGNSIHSLEPDSRKPVTEGQEDAT